MEKVKEEFTYNKKGITLIALVITIIVLLILAGVTIATLTGDNGILTQAGNAKDKSAEADAIERVQVEVIGSYGTDGNIDKELLQTNLRKIKGLENIIIENLPNIVEVDGYDIKIEKDGNVLLNKEEYIELDYIEGTGTQKIEIPYQYKNTDEIVNIVDNMNSIMYMGNWSDNFLTIGYQIIPKINATRIYLGDKWGNYVDCDYTEGIKKISIANGEQKLNDRVVSNFTISDLTKSQFDTLSVFGAVHTSWSPYWTYSTNSRIYRITINRNGNALYDMIPVLDKNKVPCLYDKVENKYYYNQGTGDFVY